MKVAHTTSRKVVRGLRPEPRPISMPLFVGALIAAAALAAIVWLVANSGSPNPTASSFPTRDAISGDTTAAAQASSAPTATALAAGDEEIESADIAWLTDFESALATATESDRPVLIDFAASWCAPCQTMDKHVWPNPQVQNLLEERVVPLRVDVDAAQAKELMKRYSIEFVPTILLVDAAGEEIDRAGFLEADGIVDLLAEIDK